MKFWIASIITMSLLLSAPLMAKPVADIGLIERHEGWGTLGTNNLHANPNKRCQVSGHITDIVEYYPSKESAKGIYLILASGDITTTVNLGPKWYVEQLPLHLEVGDYISVFGFDTQMEGEPVVIARELIHPQGQYSLRDYNGVALWTGR